MAEAATLAQPTAPRFAALPPLALYAHIPWCLKKCPYCDFNSHERRGSELPEARYVDALMADLEFALPSIWGRRVGSIFFGGGTPSLFSAASIDRALAGIRARVSVAPDAEITLEANPGTFEQAKFAGFREAGVNRLSIGIQSFDPKHLKALGRVHDEREAHAAAAAALTIFDNVNFDLMYALPGQTPEDARADADAALAYRPPHVSFYHLTIEPNTLFHRHRPSLPDEDTAADIGDAIENTLAEAGYVHYETSAFARYLEQVERGAPLIEEREVTRDEIGFEFMLNALRLTDGVPAALFSERTGFPIMLLRKELDEAERRGLLERDHQRIRPTALGRRFLNDLQAIFLRAAA